MWLQYCDVPQNEVGDYKCLTRLWCSTVAVLTKKSSQSKITKPPRRKQNPL